MVAGVLGETLGGGVISYEMLLLPLSGEDGAAGAIGSMVRIGGHDETNRIRARIVAQSLRSIRFLPVTGSNNASGLFARGPLPSRCGIRNAAALRALNGRERRQIGRALYRHQSQTLTNI